MLTSHSADITGDVSLMDLKGISNASIRSEVKDFFVSGEEIIQGFQTSREHNQVVFTTKRVFVVYVQSILGKNASYYSYPYARVQQYGVEPAGVMDINSKLFLGFINGARLQFGFISTVNIKQICAAIANHVL